MIRHLQPGLIQIRSFLVSSYLLFEEEEVCLIDGGFLRGFSQIEKALLRQGLAWENVKAVMMTHGHLDHTLNVARIVAASGAEVYGHPNDRLHFRGKYRYRGISRICGGLEKLGRLIFRYSPVEFDHELVDGEILKFWGGLKILHLPGHTAGHCGFYSLKMELLFSGDLFETSRWRTALPWPFLNTDPRRLLTSLAKVCRLAPKGILSNHCDRAPPQRQWERLQDLAQARLPYES